MIGWQFHYPLALLALFPFLLLMIWRHRSPDTVAGSGGGSNFRQHAAQMPLMVADFCTLLTLVLLIVALANPRYGNRIVTEKRDGIAIINVIDTSGSMEAIDFGTGKRSMTRLEGAVLTLQKFLAGRPEDQHGLVIFGNKVFTLAPLTADQDLILGYLQQLKTGMAGQQTALGDALGIGIRRLNEIKTPSRVIVLLTDGKSNAGSLDLDEAAQLAADAGIKVYTIGIGSNGVAPFKVDGFFGQQVQMLPVEIDEGVLRRVATKTAGVYFNARNIDQLEQVFARIDQLEKSTFEALITYRYDDHYLELLELALSLLVLSLAIRLFWLRSFPI